MIETTGYTWYASRISNSDCGTGASTARGGSPEK